VTEILRYAAFTNDPAGGNPAGVVLDASGLDETTMRVSAAEVGYSETAFVTSQANDTPRSRAAAARRLRRARHLVLAAATRERLADLDYDFARLRALMTARDWVTVALVFRRDQTTYDARNPFPTGGVVEDPATGAAAAAFGAYLRALGAIDPPARLTIHQGDDLGRPSLLLVDIPVGIETGVRVSGRAVPIDQVQEGSTI
jgi:predicted PhzF superfamily epimerase YddE/YHI9